MYNDQEFEIDLEAITKVNETHAGDVYSYECRICKKTTSSKAKLNEHHFRFHSKLLIRCTKCGTDFDDPDFLNAHKK